MKDVLVKVYVVNVCIIIWLKNSCLVVVLLKKVNGLMTGALRILSRIRVEIKFPKGF
jgi:hypothetical protein